MIPAFGSLIFTVIAALVLCAILFTIFMVTVAISILSILLILAAIFLFLSYLAYRRAFHSIPNPNKDIYRIPVDDDQVTPYKDRILAGIHTLADTPCEFVTIKSHDGLTLSGRYYHVCDGAPVHIKCHGYRSAGLRDFSGGAEIAKSLGHNSLIIDERAHGRSEGHVISFGINERYDCLGWANYITERFGKDTKIILAGVSMGAGTVLMASGLELPENVVCIFADCPFSSPWEIIKKVCYDIHLPGKLCFPFAYTAARIYGRFDLLGCSAVEEVKKSRVPILIIHGDDDRFVPWSMSYEIASANPDAVSLVTIKGAGHAMSYFADTDEYVRVTSEFIERCVKRGETKEIAL